MPQKTLTIVLADEPGAALHPLTEHRAKAAIPFGGRYRLIDFCLNNCLHSGLRQILVLTQYKSHSLHKHLRDGWSIFNPELGEFVTPVPPQMRTGNFGYAGPADALVQNRYLIERSGADVVLLMSGAEIYRMDYAPLLAAHRQSGADATLVGLDAGDAALASCARLSVEEHRVRGLQPADASGPADLGVYAFRTHVLLKLLEAPAGPSSLLEHLLAPLLAKGTVGYYPFGGERGRVTPDRYWRNVGDLDDYYAATMDLLETHPRLNLYQPEWPIRSHPQQKPPARTVPGGSGSEGIFINSAISGGSVIAGGSVQRSVLFPEVAVGDEAFVEESILFDGVRIGDGARLRRCIVEKRVEIPAGEVIGHDSERDRERFPVTPDGVVVVPRNYRFDNSG